MHNNIYDIAIIGAGAAGLHLAMAMMDEPFFSGKKILLLEKAGKDTNDRTWCFWEKNEGKWDSLLHHAWAAADFFSDGNHRSFELLPYRYKMLRAIDFYAFAKKKITSQSNFTWQKEEVKAVNNSTPIQIVGEQQSYAATHVFDSRVPSAFYQKNDPYTRLLQHFKGWYIRSPENAFDPGRFTMMDFRISWKDSSSFTYVLPISEREALIEFTLFTPDLISDSDYDLMLRRYLDEVLSLHNFDITEVEKGVIPMSDFPFEKYSSGKHIRIGTAGGWVKPSSGYSFKNCERKASLIVENLKAGRAADQGLFSRRFRFYDSVFLGVLNRRNELGPDLFTQMYLKNGIQQIFKFLDDETSIGEDLGIISSFPKGPFLKSMFRYLSR